MNGVADWTARFHRLAFGADVRPGDVPGEVEGPAALRALWRARTALLAELAKVEPWRAIYTVAAVAQVTGEERRNSKGDTASIAAGSEPWSVRNASPYGHAAWRLPPTRREASQLIDGILRQLPDEGTVDDRWLLSERQQLLTEVEEVAAGR